MRGMEEVGGSAWRACVKLVWAGMLRMVLVAVVSQVVYSNSLGVTRFYKVVRCLTRCECRDERLTVTGRHFAFVL